MARRKKRLPPSKKRYMEENPIVSIALTKKSGLKQFVKYYMEKYALESYGQATKKLLLLCMSSYPKGEADSKYHVSFSLDPKFKKFLDWYLANSGLQTYSEAVEQFVRHASETFEHIDRKTPTII